MLNKVAETQMPKEKLWNANYLKIWSANFLIYFSFMLLMPLLPLYLKDTFFADKQTIGIVLSGYTLAALFIRPFSGYIVDSYSRKTVLIICNFLFFALFAGYLVAGSITMFTIFRTVHGAPFGAVTVAGNTVAIDVLHPTRRAEGIGYYGLSNNLATAISPTIAVWLLNATSSYELLFWISLITSFIGLLTTASIKMPRKTITTPEKNIISLDRFFLTKGWREGVCMLCFSFSYGILSTYLAIYGKEELNITGGTGFFFFLLALGLMLSRLTGAKGLRKNLVARNASHGMLVSLVGYFMFAAIHNSFGYYGAALIIGLGNGHMYPAFQTMFVNLAENRHRGTANSTLLTSWDLGVGIGVLLGGLTAEHVGYHCSFWLMWIVNLLGVLYFLLRVRNHFEQNKLR